MTLHWRLGAAALLPLCCSCAPLTNTGNSVAEDSLLQRMLVAEDARGTGTEGVAPLLQGTQSADSTLRFVANRGLERLKWAPAPPPPLPPSNRPPRAQAERPLAGACARLESQLHSSDLRIVLLAVDSLASCTDDGSALLRLALNANDNVRAGTITALARSGQHAHDSSFVSALGARGYQVVLAAANALKSSPNPSLAVPALLQALDRLSDTRRENSRDERMAILNRVAELGSPANAPRIQRYLIDFDTSVAAKAAVT